MKTWKKMKNANFCILDKCTDNLFVPNENWTWNCNKWGKGEFHKPENCKTSPWTFSINSEYRSFIPHHHAFERKIFETFVWDLTNSYLGFFIFLVIYLNFYIAFLNNLFFTYILKLKILNLEKTYVIISFLRASWALKIFCIRNSSIFWPSREGNSTFVIHI